jgi:hypothetical protein|tara:strand:- start:1378 stop:2496 length:1119 start_codon:yes stop_codon:yes gene_type:complete
MNNNHSVDKFYNKKIILHVGLPKAATSFMRRAIYPRLDSTKVFHSQGFFQDEINIITKVDFENVDMEEFRNAFKKKVDGISQESLLICEFALTGNPGDPGTDYRNFRERVDYVYKVFPEASIIIILRNQIDWLISFYRNIIEVGYDISFDEFLNFHDGEFHGKTHDEYTNLDALSFDFSQICDYYVKLFGRENVHVFFQEDLRADPEDFIREIQKVVGCDFEHEIKMEKVNKGFSALALTVTRFKNRLSGGQPHTHEDSLQAKIWDLFFVRAIRRLEKHDINNRPFMFVVRNIKYRHIPAVFLRRVLINISYATRWRPFIKNVFDKLIYIDWDIAGEETRKALRDHYSKVNEGLVPYFRNEKTQKYYLNGSG